MAGRLILDAGAVIGYQRNDPKVWAYVKRAAERDAAVAVPAVVVAECVRGGARDAPIHRLLAAAHVPFVGKRVAIQAGRLLGETRTGGTVDALVAAEAIRGGPCVVLTGDPGDLAPLVGDRPYVRVVGI